MLQVAFSLTAGGLLYDRHITALQLRRAQLPAVDRLTVLLPHGVDIDAGPGDDVALTLDGGDSDGPVFTGRLLSLTRFAEGVRLVAGNGGMQLAGFRPNGSLQSLSAGDAIRRLCNEVEVPVEVESDGPDLALQALDGRVTATQRIASLALLSGQACAFDQDGTLKVNAAGGTDARIALKYGRELLALAMTASDSAGPTLSVVGEGAGSPASPEGRIVAADFDHGSAGDPGPDNRRIPLPDIRSTDDARLASGALSMARERRLQRVRLRTFLLPQLSPGLEIELADMPDHLPLTAMRATQVIHTIRADQAAVSEVLGTGHTAVDPLALLGSLAGGLL